MKHIKHWISIDKPEHHEILAFYDVATKTILENRGAADTAKVIMLLPDRHR